MFAAQSAFGGYGPLLALAFLICGIVSFTTVGALHGILRDRFPAIYESLGRPTQFANNSPQNSFAVLRFVLGGRFKETHDSEVIRLCHFIRVFTYSYWGIFVAVVVWGFVSSASQ
jgi:hypothetical protein